jgi:DNA polymerase-3 subunit beta
MKVTVKRDIFSKAIAKVANIATPKTTLPILSNILIEAKDGKLILTATDLEIRVTTSVDATVEAEGKTTVRAKFLSLLINGFTGDMVNMECDDKHHVKITCGTSKYSVNGLSDVDFPAPGPFEPLKEFVFPEAELGRMIDQISYAVGYEDHRKVLHGIYFSTENNNLCAVATDGKRLALVEKFVESMTGEPGGIIVPLKSANEIKRLAESGKDAGKAKFESNASQARITFGSTTIITKLIEGAYPNYKQVIPASFGISVDIPVPEFLSKLELVSAAIADSGQYVKLSFDANKVSLEGSGKDIYEGMDTVNIEYKENPVTISFNPQFLLDPFRHCGEDKLTVKMKDGFSPALVQTGGGFLYVIMPMRSK